MHTIDTEVLVIGAGLTGATAALLLARQGIKTMMVSRNEWVADSPRAHITNQRTMEVMRSIGLEEACRATASPSYQIANHVLMTAVNGIEFGRMWTFANDPTRVGELGLASPTLGCDLPQDRFEPILVGEANRLGVTTRFGVKFLSLEQDADGVTTTLENQLTGETFTVRSAYVIGADGGQSRVAETIGLTFTGESGIGEAINVVFKADLSKYLAHRPGSIFWILQPGRKGPIGNAMLRMVIPWKRWVIGFVHLGDTVMSLDHTEIEAAVREIIQDDDLDIEIEGVYPWRINEVYAENYSVGRVLCAGDAVHRHPPMNGLGGNTCIQDAFNLAWKIGAVLRWGAGPALLETFSDERQPVGKNVVQQALAGWRQNPEVIKSLGIDPKAAPEVRQAQFDVLFEDTDAGEEVRRAFAAAKRAKDFSYAAHGTEMNQVYESTAVIDDGSPAIEYERDRRLYYVPSARPGSRVPHAWVEYGGKTCSTLDLAKPEQFTLLTRARGGEWVAAAERLSKELGIKIVGLRVGPGCEVRDLYTEWAERSGIGEAGCVLVRPDQFVAWRSSSAPSDAYTQLDNVMRDVLALDKKSGKK
jgi:2,4-dichlorophenol 6-monooxygenase